MKFNDKVYDVLKWVAMVVLPAIAAFYCGIAAIWNLPYAEQIVGTITAFDTLLGALLGISSKSYEGDGTLLVDRTDPNGKEVYRFDLGNNLEKLDDKKKFVLKVDTTADLAEKDQVKAYVATSYEDDEA